MAFTHFDAGNYFGSSSPDGCEYGGRWNGVYVKIPRKGKSEQQYVRECQLAEQLVNVLNETDAEIEAARAKEYGSGYGPKA